MRRRWALMLAVLACTLLSGCQLARVDGGPEVGDRFAGLCLRVETPEETNKWYEQQSDREIVIEGNASMDEMMEQLFTESERWPLTEPYLAAMYEGEGEERSISGVSGDCFSEVKLHHNITDDADEFSQEATVYLVGDEEFNFDVGDTIIYLDSVYQRPDGSAYTIREDGGVSGHIDGYSVNRTTETTSTVDGKAHRNKYSCTVNFRQIDEMTAARLLEFDANNALIRAQPIERPAPGETIELPLSASAAYALVEKTVVDRHTREARIEREVCNGPFDGETIQCNLYYKDEHSIARIVYLSLEQIQKT